MKVIVYINYSSCVTREIEVEKEDEIEQAIEDLRCEITDEEILNSIQENNVDYVMHGYISRNGEIYEM